MGLVPLLSSSPLLPTKPLLLFPVWDTLVCTDPSKDIEPVEQPASLSVKLLPFQREGVAWMIHQVRACVRACACVRARVCAVALLQPSSVANQCLAFAVASQEEKSQFQGGILADEVKAAERSGGGTWPFGFSGCLQCSCPSLFPFSRLRMHLWCAVCVRVCVCVCLLPPWSTVTASRWAWARRYRRLHSLCIGPPLRHPDGPRSLSHPLLLSSRSGSRCVCVCVYVCVCLCVHMSMCTYVNVRACVRVHMRAALSLCASLLLCPPVSPPVGRGVLLIVARQPYQLPFVSLPPSPSPTLSTTNVNCLQWRAEIEAKTAADAVSVLVYYGSNRKRDVKFIQSHAKAAASAAPRVRCPRNV